MLDYIIIIAMYYIVLYLYIIKSYYYVILLCCINIYSRVQLPPDSIITQIACGEHHCMALAKGMF